MDRCGELTRDGRCRSCAAIVDKQNKNKPWREVYTSPRWRALKRTVRREQPWCAWPGCNEPTHDVDHIVPLRDEGAPYDRQNVQGLCKRHHGVKTAKEVWSA